MRTPTRKQQQEKKISVVGTLALACTAAAAAKSLQSCPTLCDPTDGSRPGSPIHGIFQARVLEWCAIAFSVLYSTGNYIQYLVINYNGKEHEKECICV